MLRSHGDVPRTRRPLMALCLQAELIPLRDSVPGRVPKAAFPAPSAAWAPLLPASPGLGKPLAAW